MDTIFMNSENSRTSEYHALTLKLTDKLDLRTGQKTVDLSNLSVYYTWKNIKSSYNNNKIKISAPTWNEKFGLPSVRIYINKIENRITFKIKNGYYLELLTPETMKLLGSTGSKITKDKNGENVPHLEVV